jgi:thermitase
LDQARPIPHAGLTLLPVQAGETTQTLVQGVNAMRATPDDFADVAPVFETPDAQMVITGEFIAAFPPATSAEEIQSINAAHGVEIVEPILGQDNTFVLKVASGASLDALAMANVYQESGLTLYAVPNFVRIKQRPAQESSADRTAQAQVGPMSNTNDTWYFDQYYLHNTGYFGNPADVDIDAPEAWDKVTGSSSIIIAVLDEGVDRFHEDLSGKMVPGYDATGGFGGVSGGSQAGNDAHGTAVAGIAAATSNNGIGVAGVCRGCRIMPIRIAYDNGIGWITQDSWQVNSIAYAWQNGAAILNNSWGGGSPSPAVTTAFNNARALGRGGLGSVIVGSAGNENVSTVSYPANLASVIAVGASNMCDQRKTPTSNACNGFETWGSNYGSALDVSAPGVWLTTTDISGVNGYSSGNYDELFNGTSGAAPIVSGVVGLILSANPALSANEVQTILQNTADDVNGGGWDSQMGYGRVNANRAVLAALPVLALDTTGVFRPSNGALYLKNTNSTGFADVQINYGIAGDYPVVGDWDGDGDATIGIYRNGSFYLRNSNSIGFADLVFPFGAPGDQPVAGDWDGNGTDTVGIYRSSAITFFLRNSNSSGAPQMTFALGAPGDVGIAGDWNGDGADTTGVFRPSNGALYLKNANTTGFADIQINYGVAGDSPITGDWNGDGIDTIGIYRNGSFYLRNANSIGFADLVFGLGIHGDHPIAGNWDALP